MTKSNLIKKTKLQGYKLHMKKFTLQREEIKKRLKKKDYLLTVNQTGDKMMSGGDGKRQAPTIQMRFACSLEEIPEYIKFMKVSWWQHEDLKKGSKVNPKDIPYEEKRWGIYSDILIEPLSKELEKSYLDASKEGIFETHRLIRNHELKKNRKEIK